MIGPGYLEAMGVDITEDERMDRDAVLVVSPQLREHIDAVRRSLGAFGQQVAAALAPFAVLARNLEPPPGHSSYTVGERERQIDASRTRRARPPTITQRSRRSLHRR